MDEAAATMASSLCAALRGEAVDLPFSGRCELEAQLRASVAYHGIGPLLSQKLARTDSRWPGALEFLCAARPDKREAAIELLRRHELERVLTALAGSGVCVLLLKGAALAYSLYPSPTLRPRMDTDLLVRETQRATAEQILVDLGYSKPNAISGRLVRYQCGYARRDRFGIDHLLDLHWRISNTQLFSRALDFEELWQRSLGVADLGKHARRLGSAHALLHACMHRAHHMNSPIHMGDTPPMQGDRLIWLYDIHLLLESMSPEERLDFAGLAADRGMRAVCRDGLLRAGRCFGTQLEEGVLLALQNTGTAEPSEACLRSGHMRYLLNELRALPGWRDRAQFLREHLFPPPRYMLAKYAVANRAWLPMLYLQRGIHGARKMLQRP